VFGECDDAGASNQCRSAPGSVEKLFGASPLRQACHMAM
jgi:hypothetical protein